MKIHKKTNSSIRKPDWLKTKLPASDHYKGIKQFFRKHDIHTICESGHCPNFGECWDHRTATFMILGDICTRSCYFCNVKTGKPNPPDPKEPDRIAQAIAFLKLKHVVITSVDRDDLPDGGARQWANTLKTIKKNNPELTIEALIPDFTGKVELINTVINENPNIVSHNIETVKRLTPLIRKKNIYDRSLAVIKYLSSKGVRSKSGFMLGLGETESEIFETMDDLINNGCETLTIGQYLQPSKRHYPVHEYVRPEKFETYKKIAFEKGFKYVESSPLVRSSYHASNQVKLNTTK